MFKNYLKVAFRNLTTQKFYSGINIVGLSIGISACILVTLYIKHDFSYDRYHKNAEQVYRIEVSITQTGKTFYLAQTPALLGPTLKNVYPEVKKSARIYFSERNLVKAGDEKNYEDRIAYADPTFFEIFTYDAVVGNKALFLKKVNSIVLTESTAKKYFGNENPLGKELEINNKYRFEVTGVIKDVPINSHSKFDFLASYASLDNQPEAVYLPQWGATFGSYTYILAGKGFDPKNFEMKAKNFFYTQTDIHNEDWRVLARPLLSIHLNSHLDDEIEENSSMSRVVILSSIAFFILLLACINFINLSTARSSKRAVEIGIRKVLGAFKIQLIKQFLGESILLSLISLVLSLITVIIVIPYFPMLVGVEIGFELRSNWMTLFLIVVGVFLVGILAGLYPALFISSYQPIKVIKGMNASTSGKKSASYLRKVLVVLQFAISIILIAGTIIVNLQLKYLREYNMGFDKNYMMVLPIHGKIGDTYKTIKNELKNITGVRSVTAAMGAPISSNNIGTECRPNGMSNNNGIFPIEVNSVDYDYMNHFGVKVVAGRNFSEEFPGDFPNAMVINEKMVKSLGFKNPQDALGKSYFISLNGFKPEIIGVVKDFNSGSLHNEVTAQVFMINPNWFKEFIIKVNSTNISSTINGLKEFWTKFFPQYPFEYNFLDESIDKMYKAEAKYSDVTSVFSVIAIFIACLGLLGLASYVTEQRKKEIGVRKVLGASILNIVKIISGEFMVLIIVSNIIAWPVAYYFMNKWLQDFAYRININLWVFILSGGIALLIALVTVSVQAIKAAVANPVESLRYE
ncbi:MAG: ABC transporter permease [Ignavibacteriaceae bacterium]|jgi:putative ABC transport system permease protein